MKYTVTDNFQVALDALPAPGQGFHPALLGVCNIARRDGLDQQTTFDQIRQHLKPGKRPVHDREIWDAIRKSWADSTRGDYPSTRTISPKPPAFDGPAAFAALAAGAQLTDPEADTWERSPFRLGWAPDEDAANVLPIIYRPDDLLFIGSRLESGRPGENIRPIGEWIELFRSGQVPPEHLIINPLTGKEGKTKAGEPSFRCDDCVARFPYVLVEFDAAPIEDQLRFFSASKLPVACLTHSGGKSVHALIRVDAATREEWINTVEAFYVHLKPLGADPANRNPARLSRLPGGWRAEKNTFQRVLFLQGVPRGE